MTVKVFQVGHCNQNLVGKAAEQNSVAALQRSMNSASILCQHPMPCPSSCQHAPFERCSAQRGPVSLQRW